MTTSLDHLARGRDNNLNLIRIVAAAMVLVSHSFVIASGNPHAEPWDAVLGRSPGGMAVDIFFVISGFLVSGSLVKQASIAPYLMARAVRIYPGLWVALLLTVLVVGWCATSASPAAFFTDPQTWRYLLRNGTMVLGAEAVLPGAFETQPFAGVVNGSLWTLRHELRLYLLLALAWWLLQRWAPARALARLRWLVTLAAVGLSALALWQLGASDRSRPGPHGRHVLHRCGAACLAAAGAAGRPARAVDGGGGAAGDGGWRGRVTARIRAGVSAGDAAGGVLDGLCAGRPVARLEPAG